MLTQIFMSILCDMNWQSHSYKCTKNLANKCDNFLSSLFSLTEEINSIDLRDSGKEVAVILCTWSQYVFLTCVLQQWCHWYKIPSGLLATSGLCDINFLYDRLSFDVNEDDINVKMSVKSAQCKSLRYFARLILFEKYY